MSATGNGDGGATAVTVDGPLPVEELGFTSIHEHLSLRVRHPLPPRTERQRRYAEQPLSMEFLGDVRRDPAVFRDVFDFSDTDLTADELRQFAELGGRTVVEVTPTGLNPDPLAVRKIARATGVNVIMGCGHYLVSAHPPEVARQSMEELAEEMIDGIRNGLLGTDVRPGVIGEIGTGDPVDPEEWKVLDAACVAQRETGLCLYVHVDPSGRTVPDVIERVLGAGVAPDRLNICHMDGVTDLDYLKRVADYGTWISFDHFGMEVYYDSYGYGHNLHDGQRVNALRHLLEAGYASQLVLGQDVCMKIQLTRFGGYGYAHLQRHILPALRFHGIDEATIDAMMVENPKRVLAVANVA
jgi:phosphotriesterase-related protein